MARSRITILEGIADAISFSRNPAAICEHVRARVRQLCAQYTTATGYLPLLALSAKWEQAFAESIVGQGDDRHLAMQPSRLTEFINMVRQPAQAGEAPGLVVSAGIRPFVRWLVESAPGPQFCCRPKSTRAWPKTVGSI